MLGVDPKADRQAIESALAKCQPVWSAGTRNPKNKHTFQSYLDQIPNLRRALLGDPSSRLAYDSELAAALETERNERLDKLQRLLDLRSAKGGLTVTDRKLLREAAVKLGLKADDLDRMAEGIPPKPEAPKASEPSSPIGPDVLDPTVRRQIRMALDHIHRRDLYDVLDLPRNAPPKAIIESADAIRKRYMQKAQVTAEKTAWLEAVSFTQSHLTNPESRDRYDRTLEVEAEDAFRETLAFALEGQSSLDQATREAILREASSSGVRQAARKR